MANTYHHGNLESALLSQAVEAVRARGAENVSLRALAAAIGVSPSAAYQHFGDKDALLAAVGESGFELLSERMRTGGSPIVGDDGLAAAARLEAIGRAYVGFALDEPHLFRLMFGPLCRKAQMHPGAAKNGASNSPRSPTSANPDDPPDPWGQTAYEILRRHLTELERHQWLRGPADDELQLLVWSVVHGFACLAIEGQVESNAVEPLLVRLRTLLYRG